MMDTRKKKLHSLNRKPAAITATKISAVNARVQNTGQLNAIGRFKVWCGNISVLGE